MNPLAAIVLASALLRSEIQAGQLSATHAEIEDDLRTLWEGLDLLVAPVRFELAYTTTIVTRNDPHFERLRDALDARAVRPSDPGLEAVLAEVRAGPLSPTDVRPSDLPLAVYGTSHFVVCQGPSRFLQRLSDGVLGLPEVLWTPQVALVYSRQRNALELVAPTEPLDLRRLESMLAPLPFTDAERARWTAADRRRVTDEGGVTFRFSDERNELSVSTTDRPPLLPRACWIRSAAQVDPVLQASCFVTTRSEAGRVQLDTVLAVQESPLEIRLDRYALTNVLPLNDDHDVRLVVPPDVTIRDRLRNGSPVRLALVDLPRSRLALLEVKR